MEDVLVGLLDEHLIANHVHGLFELGHLEELTKVVGLLCLDRMHVEREVDGRRVIDIVGLFHQILVFEHEQEIDSSATIRAVISPIAVAGHRIGRVPGEYQVVGLVLDLVVVLFVACVQLAFELENRVAFV